MHDKLPSIVIPAYNEESNVERIYDRLSKVLSKLDLEWEVIFSVDPSTDRTEERILALRAKDPRVKMLRCLSALWPADGHSGRHGGRQRRRNCGD